jgi:hypothetical protein
MEVTRQAAKKQKQTVVTARFAKIGQGINIHRNG